MDNAKTSVTAMPKHIAITEGYGHLETSISHLESFIDELEPEKPQSDELGKERVENAPRYTEVIDPLPEKLHKQANRLEELKHRLHDILL